LVRHHHSTARAKIADGGGFGMWKAAENVLNKQLLKTEKEFFL
jgi:hypothetical protein